jgi:hypothetical protein
METVRSSTRFPFCSGSKRPSEGLQGLNGLFRFGAVTTQKSLEQNQLSLIRITTPGLKEAPQPLLSHGLPEFRSGEF